MSGPNTAPSSCGIWLPRAERDLAALADREFDLHRLAVAHDGELDGVADPKQAHHVAEIGRARDRRAVHLDDHIAGLKTGRLRRRAGEHLGHHGALLMRGAERFGELRCQVLNLHADAAALDFPMSQQLVHDPACHVDRYGEADADIAAARAMMAVLMPTSSPLRLMSAPPELPKLMAASV